jgi:hypothetical protein
MASLEDVEASLEKAYLMLSNAIIFQESSVIINLLIIEYS